MAALGGLAHFLGHVGIAEELRGQLLVAASSFVSGPGLVPGAAIDGGESDTFSGARQFVDFEGLTAVC